MYTVAIILIFIVCLFLVLIVLVQNSKGGGLASSFSGNNQIMGVRRTADFLEKATWYLAGALLVLCILASAFIERSTASKQSIISEQVQSAVDPTQAPNFPTSASDIETAGSKTEEEGK
ncbi:MAG: preprotein translocase subunit SecG [Prolixibacteraceae bacterium]|nr:preprotein translocase subunit SecG [Prolixibacteraceae bacterium]